REGFIDLSGSERTSVRREAGRLLCAADSGKFGGIAHLSCILDQSMRNRSTARIGLTGVLAAALLLGLPSRPAAHEIPARVTVLAFVKPESGRLRVLMRVPLEAIRDVEFPRRGPDFLDLSRVDPLLRDAATLWIANYLELYENDQRLAPPRVAAARVSLPSDRSFSRYETALAQVTGPALPAQTELPPLQAMLDVLLEYEIGSPQSSFAIRPALAHLGIRTATVLRFLPPGSPERAFQYNGNPGLIRLDPSWHHATLQFVKLGFRHILDGMDHLLFLICLVIPFRRIRPLIVIVTAFTVAHSITLIASAAGLAPGALWFPPLIEALIALSIVFMAFENMVGARLERRWLIAFGFGLVHGFGFSFVLRDSLQFAGSHVVVSLLSFNFGVELGQLLVLGLTVPIVSLLFRYVVAERVGAILLSALVAHTAWHWLLERGNALRQHRFQWPALDLALAAALMRMLMLALIVAGAGWLLAEVFGRLARTAGSHAGHLSRSQPVD
ncbi:MAG TPA: HupE/UreJ family protein, partial [Longimicrobiales bacterium]|nr:HupE/UreJ family protein [Longimicrobiales bacterium]